MRARVVAVLALTVALSLSGGPLLVAVKASPVHLAQGGGGDDGEEVEQKPAQPSSPAPSPSPSNGEEETGPPWTYQMARISLLLLALLFVAVGAAYYRFVVRRQRGEA